MRVKPSEDAGYLVDEFQRLIEALIEQKTSESTHHGVELQIDVTHAKEALAAKFTALFTHNQLSFAAYVVPGDPEDDDA